MTRTDVEQISREVVYDGFFRLDRYRLRHRQFAGGLGPVLTREILERGRVAAVLPVDPERDRVVLIEQFRPGAWAADWEPWLLECVAGVIEPGETPEAMARREAREEMGCTVTDLVPIATFLTSPGATTETVRMFCGRVDSDGVGGLHGLAEEGEDIRVSVVSIEDAVALLDAGRIVNAKAIIALQWIARHYDALKARWMTARRDE
ncbi:MAG: NUDIX domain-containing protein [Thiotrichales bacterium]|nr:NUDIX domain-containing protein [Thiotrichales bacterium]